MAVPAVGRPPAAERSGALARQEAAVAKLRERQEESRQEALACRQRVAQADADVAFLLKRLGSKPP